MILLFVVIWNSHVYDFPVIEENVKCRVETIEVFGQVIVLLSLKYSCFRVDIKLLDFLMGLSEFFWKGSIGNNGTEVIETILEILVVNVERSVAKS